MKPAAIDPPEVWNQLWTGFTGDVGWDVGANCGQTIPQMLARFKVVHAFEPAEECAPWLNGFDEANFSWLPIALSDDDQTIELLALPDKIDTGQLVTAGTHGMEWDPDNPLAVERKVISRTVDTLVNRGEVPAPDFLKIDVEGHELKVLYGARKTLAIKRPDLLIEFHSKTIHESVKETLAGYDYQVHTVRHPHYTAGSDLWFAHGWIRATQ